MGFRVGKKVGNTYVSTNGKNVRTTTKVGKNTYYTHHYNHKQKHSSNKGDNLGLFIWIMVLGVSIGFPLWLYNWVFSTIGHENMMITTDDVNTILELFGTSTSEIGTFAFSFGISTVLGIIVIKLLLS